MPTTEPVLVMAFNRPDHLQVLLARLREVQPPRLYVAVDGARPDREGEAERVQACRDLVSTVDWDCEVQTLFQDANLGCGLGVSTAITWFFDERGARDHPRGRHHPGPELLPVLRRAARPVRARSAGVRHLRMQLRPPGGAVPSRAGVPLQPGAAHLGLGDVAPVVGAASARHRRMARPAPPDAPVGSRGAIAARDRLLGQHLRAARAQGGRHLGRSARPRVDDLPPAHGDEQREPRREHRVRRRPRPTRSRTCTSCARSSRSPCRPPRSTSCWMRGPMHGPASTTSVPRGAACSTRRIATVSSVEGGHRDDRQGPGPGHRGRGLHRLAPVRAAAGRRVRRALRRQLLLVDQGQHRPPAAEPEVRGDPARRDLPALRRGGRDLPPRLPGIADPLPARPGADDEDRGARLDQHAGPGQAHRGEDPHHLDLRGVRRSEGAPPDGGLLGQRQPHRPACVLRRGQAGGRDAVLRLPPPARPARSRSCACSTPTARACTRTTAAWSPTSSSAP